MIKIASMFNSRWKYDIENVTFESIHEEKKTYNMNVNIARKNLMKKKTSKGMKGRSF